jgi:hypothetical protein
MDQSTFYKENEKTWYTSLIFKENLINLNHNKERAMAILHKVEEKTTKDGKITDVNQAYHAMIDGNFAKKDNKKKQKNNVHYYQCYPVYREGSESTKTRIVMNASAKTRSGKSLNEMLYQGPNLLPDCTKVLIRFRTNPIAFVIDITKMFLQIKLHKDKDFLRFVWRDCNTKIPPEIFCMLSVTFGVISSPFQSIWVVHKHAEMFEKIYKTGQRIDIHKHVRR